MERIKFEVIVTDNGVTITDRDRLFYNFAVKDGEMTDNLQCDIPKGTEDERVIRSRCMDIVRNVMVIDRTMNENDSLLFDRAIDYENSPTFEEIFEELRNITRHHNMTPTSINEHFLNRKNNKQ